MEQLECSRCVCCVRLFGFDGAALCYLNFREADTARDGDPFTLYPSWYVPLGFDKAYFGGVTGIYVRFWADTGEVCDISPMEIRDASLFTNKPDAEPASPDVEAQEPDAALTAVPFVLVVVAGLVIFCLGSGKSRFYRALSKVLLGPAQCRQGFLLQIGFGKER